MKQAVAGLIINQDLKLVVVSRKFDLTDFGTPGGKKEDGETLKQALIREVKEETNLDVKKSKFFFKDVCKSKKSGTDYEVVTYLCLASGNISTQEAGKVCLIDYPWKSLFYKENREKSSFHDYNTKLINKLFSMTLRSDTSLKMWLSEIQ
jgi:8-oxo-dGTP pyrophosphatase MutT (NUDIX family)